MSSVTCHVFVANDADAENFDGDNVEDCFTTDTFASITLAELWAFMQDRNYDMDLHEEFVELVNEDDGEFIVARFPSDFVSRLATINGAQQDALVERWSKTDENERLPESMVRQMFDEMVNMAKKAKASNRNVYICNEC